MEASQVVNIIYPPFCDLLRKDQILRTEGNWKIVHEIIIFPLLFRVSGAKNNSTEVLITTKIFTPKYQEKLKFDITTTNPMKTNATLLCSEVRE